MAKAPRAHVCCGILHATTVCALFGAFGCDGGQTNSTGSSITKIGSHTGGRDGSTAGTGGAGTNLGSWSGNSPSACSADADCMRTLEAYAAKLREVATRTVRRLVDASCEQRPAECPGRSFCRCVVATQSDGAAQVEAIAVGLNAGCDTYGRSGECLLPASAFAGCEPGDACSCAAVCEHAMAVGDDDAKRMLDVEARYAECVGRKMCRTILRIGERCVAGFGAPGDISYDCALSDNEILRRAFPPAPDAGPAPDCTHGCDAGSSTATAVAAGCGVTVGVCASCYNDAAAFDCAEPDGG